MTVSRFGVVLGLSWSFLASLWAVLGLSWVGLGRLGPLLEEESLFWERLGPSWDHLGPSRYHLGPSLEPSSTIFGPSWAILHPPGGSGRIENACGGSAPAPQFFGETGSQEAGREGKEKHCGSCLGQHFSRNWEAGGREGGRENYCGPFWEEWSPKKRDRRLGAI